MDSTHSKAPRPDQTVPYLQAARERAAEGRARADEDTLTMDGVVADVAAVTRCDSMFERYVVRVCCGMSPEAAARACRRELEEDGNG